MYALGPYDGTLQMFTRQARDPDPRHLRFLRWLAERGALEHEVAGPPGEAYRPQRSEGEDDPRPLGG